MHKTLLLPLISFLLVNTSVVAQEKKMWVDENTIKSFSIAARKDPAYVKMRAQIDALSKSATKTNTNATAVRQLLEANSATLSKLYKESNIKPARIDATITPFKHPNSMSSERQKEWSKIYPLGWKQEVPPYDKTWTLMTRSNDNQVFPDTTGTQFSTGKTVFTLQSDPGKKIGPYFHGQEISFTVPSNPRITVVNLILEFSLFFTGWDTYGAIFGADLIIEGSDNLGGDIKTKLSPYDAQPKARTNWRKLQSVIRTDTVTTEFQGFHRENDSYYFIIANCLVTPGSTFTLKVGVGYPKNARLGANGNYHYGQFILKNITAGYSSKTF